MQRIHQGLLLSQDEVAVQLRTDGREAPNEEAWVILSKGADTKTQAAYVPERRRLGTTRASYTPLTTVRLNVLMSAGCQLGNAFMLVTGASTDEVDLTVHPSGVVLVEVPGMSLGVGNAASSSNSGFICIVVGSNPTTQEDGLTPIARAHLVFLERVVRPFIESVRKQLGWREGAPIPQSLRAVLLNDGAFDQVPPTTHHPPPPTHHPPPTTHHPPPTNHHPDERHDAPRCHQVVRGDPVLQCKAVCLVDYQHSRGRRVQHVPGRAPRGKDNQAQGLLVHHEAGGGGD